MHARHTAKLANAVAKELVETKAEALLQGKGNRDILSLLGILHSTDASSVHHTYKHLRSLYSEGQCF